MSRAQIGHKVSLATRKKIGLINKGKKISEAHKRAITKWAKENPDKLGYWKNKKFSESHLKALREARVGRKPSLGMKHTPETKVKFSIERKLRWKNRSYREKGLKHLKKMWINGKNNPFWKGGVWVNRNDKCLGCGKKVSYKSKWCDS